jgi:translation initiation factor IF-3|tara:strand:- start:6734 stop:7258 length:525 start_codon:yes stop_codon:yes gene_type:complete
LQKKSTLINSKIKSDTVMLIDQDGNKKGMMPKQKAIEIAESLSLDLVQVSPAGSDPVVCKILDYGKYVFTKKKNTQGANSRSKKTSLKEIKFRPSTDVGDYNIKLKKIKSFILGGDKTKISIRFRGREILNSDLGLELLNKIKTELEELSQVDQEPSLEGRQLQMVLSPLKKKG